MTDAILKKIADVLKDSPFRIKNGVDYDSKIKSLPKWDSLKHLMFLMEMEKRFKIEILPEEIASIVTIKDVAQKINKNDPKRAKKSTARK